MSLVEFLIPDWQSSLATAHVQNPKEMTELANWLIGYGFSLACLLGFVVYLLSDVVSYGYRRVFLRREVQQ